MNKFILIAALVLAGPVWAEEDHSDHAHSMSEAKTAAPSIDSPTTGNSKASIYYCPMHPKIQQDGPGTCPICSMDLVPLEQADNSDEALPESLKGLAQVNLSPWKQQLIGMKTAEVKKRNLSRVIDTVGRFGGGKGNFATAASGFTAKGSTDRAGARYVIADIYALDIPYVKVGQKAEVRGFASNSRASTGWVSKIYPYDGTQSRVRRVRVDLDKGSASEMFANVRIFVRSPLVVAIPAEAVIDSGRRRYVFVEMEPGKLMPHIVEIGFQGEDYWEAIEGVKKNDKVVVGANFLVDADSQLKAVLRGLSAGADGHQP